MYGVTFTAAGGTILFNTLEWLISMSDASVFVAFSPTITAVLSTCLLKDSLTKLRILGLVFALVGVIIIAWQ